LIRLSGWVKNTPAPTFDGAKTRKKLAHCGYISFCSTPSVKTKERQIISGGNESAGQDNQGGGAYVLTSGGNKITHF
jgi:hypothetical protein